MPLPTPNTVLSGTFTGANGAPIAGLPVFIYLTAFGDTQGNQPSIWFIGGEAFIPNAPGPIEAVTNSEGFFTATIYGNDVIQVTGGSYYVVTAGNFDARYMFVSNNSYDLSTAVPLSPNYQGQGSVIISTQGPQGPQGLPGTSNVPWFDIQNYGGVPKDVSYAHDTAGATTQANNPDVTVASGGWATNAKNGMGVCIWKAGLATALNTAPAAPTVTAPNVQGGQTITYKIVAFDNLGGLSPASSAGTVTNAPAVFGPVAQQISSISQSSGVVTVNFSTPLNTTVTAGMTIHIKGFGAVSGDKIFNGVWTLASAPSTTQVTFALSGNYGSGTCSAATTGRLSNAQIITAISRNASGLLTITTAESNNSIAQATNKPTVVVVENCYPDSINGQFVVSNISGTTILCQTGNYSAVTGTSVANGDTTNGAPTSASTATVYEYIEIVCPTLASTDSGQTPPTSVATTCGYYIYSDWGSGGALNLIGKVVGGNSPTTGNIHFQDWGPTQASGFVAPAYVPTTPSASTQNQMFTSTIVSGGGTTSLVLANNVPTAIGSLGATILYDDGPCLLAACAAMSTNESKAVLLSGPTTTTGVPQYVFNSPITIPSSVNVLLGCGCTINETLDFASTNQLLAIPSVVNVTSPQFSQRNYVNLTGIASPMVAGNNTFTVDGVCITLPNNNQYGMIVSGLYSHLTNVAFNAGTNSSSVPLIYQNASSALLENFNADGDSVFGSGAVVGQSAFGPPIPLIWFRTSDNPNLNDVPPAQVVICGTNTMFGRGILFDSFGATTGEGTLFRIGDSLWDQGASTPTIMFWGSSFHNVDIAGIINDSSQCAALANWTAASLASVSLKNSENAGDWPLITGNPIVGLTVSGVNDAHQTVNIVQNLTGTANIGASNNFPPNVSKTLQAQPLELGTNGVLFAGTQVTGVAASASGVGTFTAGVWTAQISVLGFDGNESALSSAVSVTVNGSQGIAVSWTALPGYAGYFVYLSGFRQSNTPIAIGTTSHTYTGFNNQGTAPSLGATGPVSVSAAGIVAQKIILSVGGAPANSSATGSPGQLAWDGTYLYICVATNTWQRVATASF
jgi:hypothetical protein